MSETPTREPSWSWDNQAVVDPNNLVWTDSIGNPYGVEDTAHAEAPGPDIFDSFKDSQGRYRTQSLFIEHSNESYPAFFTLKKVDRKGAISMYRKYMEIADPTEYQVAIQLLGSWDHWQALKRSKWFTEELTGWREELKVKLESERYHEMRDVADTKTPQAIQATKWLADRYGGTKAKRGVGRPSKAEKQAHLDKLTRQTEDTKDDAERIGLK